VTIYRVFGYAVETIDFNRIDCVKIDFE